MVEDNELTEEQKKELGRAYALESLRSEYITNIASAGYSKPKEGEFPRYGTIFSELYKATTDKAPSQKDYDRIMRDDLQSDEGSLSKQRLMGNAMGLIARELMKVTVNDVLALMGSPKAPKSEFDKKYMGELGLAKEEKLAILDRYLKNMSNMKAEAFLARERGSIVGGLENIFCESDE